MMTNYDILKEYEVNNTPVPSYDEWQELSKQRNQLIRDVKDLACIQEENQQLRKFLEEFNALDVAKENQKLKELLLECSEYLYEILTGTHLKLSFKLESGIRKKYYMMNLSKLITKTINAIGEKK